MYVNSARNVCGALPATMKLLMTEGVRQESRAGPVLVLPEPLMTQTRFPRERALFSVTRDANPFFHLVEAIWMLAGRDDADTLNRYVRDFGDRFAERPRGAPLPEDFGNVIHDAYGRRWRSAMGFDQLDAIVRRLTENPDDRQCVIQMWDASYYGKALFPGENDLLGDWKTRPCNTHCYVRVHDGKLDLTVCCRSNDMVWGGHGANAVHFSVLQEYLAARVDAAVGYMYQLSNNAHVYVDLIETLSRRAGSRPLGESLEDDRYEADLVRPEAMFAEPARIDDDIREFMDWHDEPESELPVFDNPWFETTLARAVRAHRAYKYGDINRAIDIARDVSSLDWSTACVEWLERRRK